MVIQHNMTAMYADRSLNTNVEKWSKDTERLSSGYRINRAADDAAGLTISEKMRWQIRGLNRASRNIQDGISLIQVADGALQEVHSILQRMNELSVQAANDTNTDEDRAAICDEIDNLKSEINRISTDTTYNEIRIFKPTNVPEVTGYPTDILVYHEDYNGTTRVGGIIYNGQRYAYGTDIAVDTDDDGNVLAGEYSFNAEGENGDVTITLVFDGGSRTPSARKYELNIEETGISIDGIIHTWSEITDEDGNSFDKDNITAGTYSFEHAGLTISFELENDMDFASFKDEMQPDGLTSYEILSSASTSSTVKVTPTVSWNSVEVTAANQDYISFADGTVGGYKMLADDSGVTMYIPSTYSNTGQNIDLTTMTWEQLGLSEWSSGESVNPSSTVSGGEKNKVYTYTDSDYTGLSISFTVDSEVSKQELIDAINAWQITPSTNTSMTITPSVTSSATTISLSSYSSSLDSYKTQYNMGRTMGTQMVLQSGMLIQEDGDNLYFTMTDANGQTYTFTASDVKNTITRYVTSNLNTYVTRYASAYASLLNAAQSTSVGTPSATSSYSSTLSFTGTYSVGLRYTQNFSGWLTKDMFDVSYTEYTDSDGNTQKRYSVSAKSDLVTSTLASQLSDYIDDIYDAFTNTTMTIKTDNNTTRNTGRVTSATTTKNVTYDSVVNAGDREMNIQSSALAYQAIVIALPAMNTSILGISGADVSTHDGAEAAIASVQKAIEKVSGMRSDYGATQNRLEKAMSVDDITHENTQAAESLLRDADLAEEILSYSTHNILVGAGQSILAQANQSRDYILALIQ